jgi:transposase
MDQMPESTPVFDALDGGAALQINGADVNIAELPQDVDALKSIIARLLQASSIQEREYAKSLDQIELRLQSERQIMMVAHQVEQQRMAAAHAAKQHEIRDAHQAEQQKMLAAHTAEQAKLKAEFELRIQKIYESIVLARRRKFGPSSEANSIQGRLFDEAELLALTPAPGEPGAEASDLADLSASNPEGDSAVAEDSGSVASKAAATKKSRGKRLPLAAELPRVEIVHDVPESERVCPCGTPMVVIGQEVSEQLDVIPMRIQVLRHIRLRYGCPKGEQAPVVAPAPLQVLPKSNASERFLATLLALKYVDSLPLARIEYVLGRAGARVTRQTLARWVIGTAQALQPIANLMRDALLESRLIYMDETRVQVLKEPGRDPTTQSYMWVQRGGPPEKPVILFDYDPSRSGQIPMRLLQGWQGFLMTDGYEGYGALAREPGIEHLACWAHARRKFVDAVKVQPKGKRSLADQAVEMIGKLYRIEREIRDKPTPEKQTVRQDQSQAMLDKMRVWLNTALPAITPQSKLGEALAYLHKYWPRLIRYVEHGDLPIDNNPCENAIRPFVIGRKNWLFSDSQAGAHASALIYSLIETAKANGQEPSLWLTEVLSELPYAQTADDYDRLLPWNIHPKDLAINPKP